MRDMSEACGPKRGNDRAQASQNPALPFGLRTIPHVGGNQALLEAVGAP